MDADQARELLKRAGLFYYDDEDPPDVEEYPDPEDRKRAAQMLNMNDTWGWATAFGQAITDEELPEVGRLFIRYGYCGVLYWVSEKNEQMHSEFADINRFVDFVRAEEKAIKDCPDWNKRAYFKVSYRIPATSGWSWPWNRA